MQLSMLLEKLYDVAHLIYLHNGFWRIQLATWDGKYANIQTHS